MIEKYEQPILEVIRFDRADVITSSTELDISTDPGEGGKTSWDY